MEGKTIGECFQYNEETRKKVDKLEDKHDKLAERLYGKLDEIEAKFMNRLPIWASILIGFLMSLVGGFIMHAIK